MKHAVLLAGICALGWGAGDVRAQMPCADTVYAVVDTSGIRVHHVGALYNCCPEFGYAVTMEGQVITVTEYEVLQQCWCVCCMDLSVNIGGVAPGQYVLEFHWFDYESTAWLMWPLDVVVPRLAFGRSDPYIMDFRHSDCYDQTPVPGADEDRSTWSTLKSLYR